MHWLLITTMIHLLPASTDPAACEEYAAASYPAIHNASRFTTSAVGYSGTTPGAVKELRCILRSPRPAVLLESMLKQSTLAGQLYVLAGIRVIDRARFRRLSKPYKSDKRIIDFMSGCILSNDSVGHLIALIDEDGLAYELAGVAVPPKPGEDPHDHSSARLKHTRKMPTKTP